MEKAKTFRLRVAVASEKSEGQAFMRWCRFSERMHPEIESLYHIPNGGARDVQTGFWLKKEGVKSGMPDYCLPVMRGGYGALYIELKRKDGGQLSDTQRAMHHRLRRNYNCVRVCNGWESARNAVLEYLELPHPEEMEEF